MLSTQSVIDTLEPLLPKQNRSRVVSGSWGKYASGSETGKRADTGRLKRGRRGRNRCIYRRCAPTLSLLPVSGAIP